MYEYTTYNNRSHNLLTESIKNSKAILSLIFEGKLYCNKNKTGIKSWTIQYQYGATTQ